MVRVAPDPVINTVLFDWRLTLFADEDAAAWVRNAAVSIGRTLSVAESDAIVERLDRAEKEPEIAASLGCCDCSLQENRDAMLAWFRAADIDDELAMAIWKRDGDPAASFPYPDTAPVLRALRQLGCRTGVVSDIHYDIRALFRHYEIFDYVDAWVLSFEHGIQKPDTEVYAMALTALDARPEETLMVGDRYHHDGVAASIGITSLILPAIKGSGVRGLDAVLRLVG
jgi:FMN phosphatase YigB (HAD superfamily)